jgi:RsiW-degrading membrane proteinase PrsW (M82 family)
VTAEHGPSLRPVLLVAGSTGAALLAFSLALVMLRYGDAITSSPAQTAILAASLGLTGALSLPAIYYALQSRQGRGVAAAMPRPLGIVQFAVLLALWLGSLVGTQSAVNGQLPEWSVPLTHILGIGLPVFLVVRGVTGGLGTGSSGRLWGLLTAGMWFGTGLATLVEGALGILALLSIGAYLVLHPDQLAILQTFAQDLRGVTALPDALESLRPWLDRPEAFFVGLFVFAGLTPVIEETAKSVATWGIFDRLRLSSDGFVAGALAGAGFGLVEGLLASASADAYSTATLVARAGSTMMHVAAGAWAGQGIAEFRRTRAVGTLVRGYFAAIGTHGLWNASIVLIAFGGLHMGSAAVSSNLVPLALMLLGGFLLATLLAATLVALMLTHRRLRLQGIAASQSTATGSMPSSGATAQGPNFER